MKYDTKRRQAATSERLCDCGRQAVVFRSNSYVCSYCLSQPPASAYLDHGGSECEPFQVHLASYDPEVSADENAKDMRVAGVFVVLVLLLSIFPARADYTVESSTNLTEWSPSSAAWPVVLEIARTNPATAGNQNTYYYRLSPPESDAVASSTNPSEWTSVRLAPDDFHAARQIIPPPPPAPIKQRVSIGDPFFPIPSRSLGWTYDTNFTGSFEIWWGNNPSNLVQIGETQNRSWRITAPVRLGWFGVRARTVNGFVSKWATAPNLK